MRFSLLSKDKMCCWPLEMVEVENFSVDVNCVVKKMFWFATSLLLEGDTTGDFFQASDWPT